jgi:hypothetical protein
MIWLHGGFYAGLTSRRPLPGWMRREQPTESKSDMRVHVWCGGEPRSALQKASGYVGTDMVGRHGAK